VHFVHEPVLTLATFQPEMSELICLVEYAVHGAHAWSALKANVLPNEYFMWLMRARFHREMPALNVDLAMNRVCVHPRRMETAVGRMK
jgi:hypothetical protein